VSRFTDHLGLVLLEDSKGPVTRDGRSLWAVQTPLTYDVGAEGSSESITVPAGFVTDLASIPAFAWSLGFPADGPWAKAAVVHDFLYATAGTCVWHGKCGRTRVAPYTRAEADGILREAMGVLGVPAWRRFVIWSAVRVGGGRGWSH
jgi:hypothetical protein